MTGIAANALLVFGVAIMTLAVVGMFRLPDVYTQLHASSKAAGLGVVAILAAAMLDGGGAITARAVLVAAFVTITTPVAAHAVARAAYLRGERLEGHDAIDESGRGLDR